MATFDFLIKQIQKNTLAEARKEEFSTTVKNEVLSKNYKISTHNNQKILTINGQALCIMDGQRVCFTPKYSNFLNDESKKTLSKLFGEESLVKESFKINKEERIQEIISYYDEGILGCASLNSQSDTGGQIRYKKGELVESLSDKCCKLAVDIINEELGKTIVCSIEKETVSIKHKTKPELSYEMIVDRLVKFDNVAVAHIEAKAYADLSMYKRTIADASLVQENHKLSECILFELEKGTSTDSVSVEVVNSYYPNVKIHCFSLFDNNRRANKEIHTFENLKSLTKEQVESAVLFFKKILLQHISN